MKVAKIYLLLFLMTVSCSVFGQQSDTIVVRAHQDVVIKTKPSAGQTLYPAWAKFPTAGTEYYKVIAYLTFECAPELKCGEWDYSNHIYIGKTNGVHGDSLGWEIGRFITPYGFYWHSSQEWKHGWYYDMTDFAPLLHDSVQIVYRHTGYESNTDRGWKINLSFFLLPGTPPLSIQNITPLWSGSFRYGNDETPIADLLVQKKFTFGPTTKNANIKIIQTGHGMDDPGNCAEFCKKWRQVKYDGTIVDERYIWRECGFISSFPQAGTWLYDRANWCPGETVIPHDVYLHNLSGGTEHTFDLIMEPYTASKNFGRWSIASYMIEYGTPNYTIDASIEEIIAPSMEYGHTRLNPICGVPVIVVKNNGIETLKTMTFKYGPKGGLQNTLEWTGSLAFLQSDTIYLQGVPDWHSGDGSNIFSVELLEPNGKKDEFPQNNTAFSSYELPPVHPSSLRIGLNTNKAASENYLYLINLHTMEVVFSQEVLQPSKDYAWPVRLEKGCYSLELYDDGPPPEDNPLNKDGLEWWANKSDGVGSFKLLDADYNPIVTFEPDFGTKILYQFMVVESVDIGKTEHPDWLLEILPNPSTSGVVQIKYNLEAANTESRQLVIKDLYGRTRKEYNLTDVKGEKHLDLSGLSKGVYIVTLQCDSVKMTKKLILQ